MVAEEIFVAVSLAAVLGLSVSVLVERLMRPRPAFMRPWPAWALHGGLWLLVHAALTLMLGRPWFAAAAVSAFLLMLVLVNNAKFKALREPFVLPDFEYFTDAIRHPRLYIPFLGWGKFLLSAFGFGAAVALGLWGESVPRERLAWSGQLGALIVELVVAVVLIIAGQRGRLRVDFDAERDVSTLGLLASLWRYAAESSSLPAVGLPDAAPAVLLAREELPHLIAVQSESFFDVRDLFAGIRPEVLTEFDRLKAEALSHGKLKVPAWGANTVRSEFAFLSGLGEADLGVHRFNPYRAIAKGWQVANLARQMKQLGYRTVAIHPYPASFYLRDRVYPRLGFDEFLDIKTFADAKRTGPYVGDLAVARKIEDVIGCADGPVFVFAVTMENHGPLHLEKVSEGDEAALYRTVPPAGCEDLTIYLRHLRNADQMMGALRTTLQRCGRRAELCWYGDHVPIMPRVYEAFGMPSGEVDYLLWSSLGRNLDAVPEDVTASALARKWLGQAGLL
jgi:phosphoglycerol transferase MdoB-like AlkP superfamily enzyme